MIYGTTYDRYIILYIIHFVYRKFTANSSMWGSLPIKLIDMNVQVNIKESAHFNENESYSEPSLVLGDL